MPLKDVTIYTDGACSGNPGPGGWGVLMQAKDGGTVVKERTLSGGEPATTNNRPGCKGSVPSRPGWPAH